MLINVRFTINSAVPYLDNFFRYLINIIETTYENRLSSHYILSTSKWGVSFKNYIWIPTKLNLETRGNGNISITNTLIINLPIPISVGNLFLV